MTSRTRLPHRANSEGPFLGRLLGRPGRWRNRALRRLSVVSCALVVVGVVVAPRLVAQEQPPPWAEIDIASQATPVIASPALDFVPIDLPVACHLASNVDIGSDPTCDLSGQLYFRPEEERWQTIPIDDVAGVGIRVLLPLPDVSYIDYYLEVTEHESDTTVAFPYEGARGPMRLFIMPTSRTHHLDALAFGAERAPSSTISLAWGSGWGQVGLLPGNESQTIGPQGFDVGDDGRIHLLDQVNSRVLLIGNSGQVDNSASVDVGPLGDLAVSEGEGFYVLDRLPSGPGSEPVVRFYNIFECEERPMSIDCGETPLQTQASPEEQPVFLSIAEGVVWVYGTPSDGWRPVMSDIGNGGLGAVPTSLGFQMGMPSSGGELLRRVKSGTRIDLAYPSDLDSRVSIVSPSDRLFGELAVVERLSDGRILVVARTWRESPTPEDHHEVILLSATGELVDHFSIANSEYAESGSLSQFRLGGDGDLYQLWTDVNGLQIRRFEIGA